MNGFERRTEKIKQRIKQATIDLLIDMEPRNLRIIDIVKQADVSQVTIYKHFGSKENLIREAVQDWYMDILERTVNYMKDPEKSFQDKISFIIFNKKQSVHQFSIDKLNKLMLEDNGMKTFINKVYHDHTLPLMIDLVEQGRKEGAIHHTFPTSLIMFYLNIFMEKAASLTDFAKNYTSEDAFIEDIMQLFFYGVTGKRH
ncbi:transcriptional regulator BetI [Paraliobacillus sp. PM-2]|uniref:TetR/AcrR family transcriptional regulator n=1 Tax=Paraliobacillus sp. PM-2 TaxID=1462524 RepID=UPI00061CA3B0|nr:TetR/AcrR family transcriptional regulator [Paraliobacillus sp. PM-2]CQR47758.1 transcriptional regulator BetI [Paraliobacillus sp. PM-2]